MDNSSEYMVDIQSILKQLLQLISDAEWHGEPCDHLKAEYTVIYNYHQQTGSLYYPLF